MATASRQLQFSQLQNVFKLRIGFAIMLTALAGLAMTPNADLSILEVSALAVAVLVSAAAAGALNQYLERDLDGNMARTANRPFVTGEIGRASCRERV